MSDEHKPLSRRAQKRANRALDRLLKRHDDRDWTPRQVRDAERRYGRDMKKIKKNAERDRGGKGCGVAAIAVGATAVKAVATWRGAA